MNVYVTAHAPDFLPWQQAAVERFVPDAIFHIVATANALPKVIQQAAMHLKVATTPSIVPELLGRVAPGPGMILEWDMVPVAPVIAENAVASNDIYGIYPSVIKWADTSALNPKYVPGQSLPFCTHFRVLPQQYIAEGCAAGNNFQMVGSEILHYHYQAAFRKPNGFEAGRKRCWLELMANAVGEIHHDYARKPEQAFASPQQPQLHGPGTELKKILSKFGITAGPNCSCNARASTMDANGCDWCEENLDTVVGWLREEAAKRGLPFLDAVGKVLVRRAIKLARKDAARGTQAKNDGDGPPAV